MRQDTVALVQQALASGTSPYVLVNNRAEGCAPLTVQALTAELHKEPSLEGRHESVQ